MKKRFFNFIDNGIAFHTFEVNRIFDFEILLNLKEYAEKRGIEVKEVEEGEKVEVL